MRTDYKPLCCVQLRHEYFTNGTLSHLVAAPTPATASRLLRAGLLFRPQPDGFVLLYSTANAYLPLSKLSGLFPLLFGLVATDALFMNYTNLPLVPPGPENAYCLRLPAGSRRRVVRGQDQLPLRPLYSTVPLPMPHPALTVELLEHPLGPASRPWQVPATSPVLALDLRPWGSGRYRLRLNDQEQVFFADDYLYRTRPWGLLEVGAEVLAAPSTDAHIVQFEARSTYWQYQFVPRQAVLPPLRIANTAPVRFEAVAPLPGAAASYRASRLIKLAQRYKLKHYALFPAAADPLSHPLVAVLPQASPASLRLAEPDASPRYISDIFVQV